MGIFEDIKKRGIWRGYERHVLRLEPILTRMSERGIPVDPEKHAEVDADLERRIAEYDTKMQAMIPDEVKPKKEYKREPKDTTGYVLLPSKDYDEETHSFPVRWHKILPWKPSHKGLINYMTFKGHPVPRNWKTGKATVEELELARLARRVHDPLYDIVRERSDLATLKNNHIKNWKPGPDGRVHPTFYYETATGQLAARRPNSMNAPHHKEVQGDIFRSLIVAPHGHSLLELDYKSFHVQTLAFMARDPDLLRLAKMDIHSYLTAHLLHLPDAERCLSWPDDQLREYLAAIKKQHKAIRDAKVKHALLGYNNGMGYRRLYNKYREFFSNLAEAKKVMDLLDGLFPRTKRYREETKTLGLRRGWLVSPAGSIRYFWDPMNDGEAALSFFTQNIAHGHLKDAMIRLDDAGWNERAALINPVHDALMYLPSDDILEEAAHEIALEMERPSEILVDPIVAPNGLSIEVTVSIGKSWNKMIEMPRGKNI